MKIVFYLLFGLYLIFLVIILPQYIQNNYSNLKTSFKARSDKLYLIKTEVNDSISKHLGYVQKSSKSFQPIGISEYYINLSEFSSCRISVLIRPIGINDKDFIVNKEYFRGLIERLLKNNKLSLSEFNIEIFIQ